MKTLVAVLLAFPCFLNAQTGGGWDWAFNTGSMGPRISHLAYQSNGDLLFGGATNAAAYFGATTLTAPPLGSFPGAIQFLGKVANGSTTPVIIRSWTNTPFGFDCITSDGNGNYFAGGSMSGPTTYDFGNGVTISGANWGFIAKFNALGEAQWARMFDMGGAGAALTQIYRLQVAASGNIFFFGRNPNSKRHDLVKLDASGNTLWTVSSNIYSLTSFGEGELSHRDRFVDDNENVHLFAYGLGRGIRFGADTSTAPLVTIGGVAYTHHISVSGSGATRFINSYRGGGTNASVDRATGNVSFSWGQYEVNSATLAPLLTFGQTPYPGLFSGIVICNSSGTLLKQQGFYATAGTLGEIKGMIQLAGGGLVLQTSLYKSTAYSAGTDYLYGADASNIAVSLVEMDANLVPVKMITSVKSPATSLGIVTPKGDGTYAMSAYFNLDNTATLPTTQVGGVTYTGFNAAPNLTTAYGIYSTSSSLRADVVVAQTNSANWPTVSTTVWQGITTDWNNAANWSNGVPGSSVKAVFNNGAANYPTTFSTPAAGSLQINAGVTVTLPASLTLAGGLRNNGVLRINNPGFFMGFGASEIRGTGMVEFTGASANYFFYSKPFDNSLTLNQGLTLYNNLVLPQITLNASTGKVDMGSKAIFITDAATNAISGASATNYFINGNLKRAVNSSGTYTFPLGTSSLAQTATITTSSLTGTSLIGGSFTAGAPTGTQPSTTINGISVNQVLNGGLFTIEPDVQPSGGTYAISLSVAGSTNTGSDANALGLIKRSNSASAWAGAGTRSGAIITGGVATSSSFGLTSFSDFAIGKGVGALPVRMVAFTVTPIRSNAVKIDWQTATEEDNKGFFVQHSPDGLLYESLGWQPARGSGSLYQFTHSNVNSGIHFYRLQQVDNNGRTNFSEVRKLQLDDKGTALQIFPNPATGFITFNRQFSAGNKAVLYDVTGKIVYSTVLQGNRLALPSFPDGSYTLSVTEAVTGNLYKTPVLIRR